MNKDQIAQRLTQIFATTDRRVVFWYDPDRSFDTEVNELCLDGVVIWRLDEHGPLATKLEIERSQPEAQFLVYAPFERPEPQDDWLLDIFLYAEKFSADPASVLLATLGLQQASLTTYLAAHMDFFNSKTRVGAVARLVHSADSEDDLDLKILTVLSRADFARIEAIALALFGGFMAGDGDTGFHCENARWEEIRKFKMESAYWRLVSHHWGYTSESPSLRDLFLRLTVTHLYQHVVQEPGAVFPDELRRFVLTGGANALNASVFISNWMQSARHSDLYAQLSEDAEFDLNLDAVIGSVDASMLGRADTFEVVEKHIVVSCLDRLLQGGRTDMDYVTGMIGLRRDRFWAGDPDLSYGKIYDALGAAARMFSLKTEYGDTFKYKSADKMFSAYGSELYAFDQAYRQFYAAAMAVKQGLDVLKKELMPAVENFYCNWYVPELALAWGRCVEAELLPLWSVPGVPSQRTFFKDSVQPILDERDTSRAYVIISDALRFEIAEELNRLINTGDRISSEVAAMLGVLPSCTSCGMAALLPHEQFMLDAEGRPVLDGKAAGPSDREKVLRKKEASSLCVKAEDLLSMTTQAGRELVKDSRVVYVYHNRIDAIGDKQATEENTFEAVACALQELKRLVEFIHGCLNGSRILVTADHGFLFQMGDLASTDKNSWESGGHVMESKKRYVVGSGLPNQTEAWKLKAEAVYGTASDIDIVVPKGAQRFHFMGGARFAHGGALLQEVVVPVLTLRGLKGRKAETGKARKVDVQLLDTTNMKVSNNRQRFSFLQTTRVEGKILPRTLRIAFFTGGGEQISDEHLLTFDSASDQIQDRQRDVLITLKSGNCAKGQDYYLVLTDSESGAEYKKIPFRINLGIGNEFGEW
jgi:uncharacterized protein (TIGR02687 family)